MHFVFAIFLISFSLFAHQTSLTPGGRELFWANPSVPIVIRTNTSDMSAANVNAVVLNSMAQWNASSSAKVTAVGSSVNEIKFVSNFPYGSGVVGITEVNYNTAGAIQKAVVMLNDDYYFHNSEGFYGTSQVYLGDVVTHELGHLFGLSHSEVLNSSMFYANFPGQNTVALDDITGIRQKYDSGHGSISGVVKGGQHVGVLGAHVQAISRKTGEATAAISDENGNFHLGGLDLDDTYYLYTSPIKKTESLPGYFSNTQDEFCPSAYVGSFFSQCGRANDGKPVSINLSSLNQTVDVGTVTINCSLRADEAYTLQKLQSTFSPVTIFNYQTEPKYEKSFVGWFRKPIGTSWSSYDILNVDLTSFGELSGNPKYLKISLVSYPFGNQLEYQMNVKQNGSSVPAASRSLVGPSSNGTYNPDFSSLLMLSNSAVLNNFEINIRSRKLTSSIMTQTFPSISNFTTDQHLPYLLVVSLWESTSDGLVPMMDSAVNLSDNESCLDAPFTYAVAQAKSIEEQNESNSDQTPTAACGTIEPPKSGPPSTLPLMTLGFLLTFLVSTIFKGRKKFLS